MGSRSARGGGGAIAGGSLDGEDGGGGGGSVVEFDLGAGVVRENDPRIGNALNLREAAVDLEHGVGGSGGVVELEDSGGARGVADGGVVEIVGIGFKDERVGFGGLVGDAAGGESWRARSQFRVAQR